MPSIQFKPPFIAHRGASHLAPENTLSAFLKAKAVGANWVEFDVVLAKCGEAVVIHDATLERTTNGKGRVCDYTYQYLQTLDAGSWFDYRFAGERIPTFKDVILCLQQHRIDANIEIKPTVGFEEQTARKVIADLQRYWTTDSMPPLISSFSVPVLQYIKQWMPQANTALLIHEWFTGWEELADQLHCFSVNLNNAIIDKETVAMMKSLDKAVLCYTVNDPERAQELFSWGVDAVFSDNVEIMLKACAG